MAYLSKAGCLEIGRFTIKIIYLDKTVLHPR